MAIRSLAVTREWTPSRSQSSLELVGFAVGFAAWVGTNVALDTYHPAAFAIVSSVVVSYASMYFVLHPRAGRYWGFRLPDRVEGLSVGAGVAAALFVALLVGAVPVPGVQGLGLPTLCASPAVYLLWCIIQDFVFFSVLTGHLRKLGLRPWTVIGTSAVCFAFSHLPFLGFTSITFFGGLLFAWMYVRGRCIYAVTACHWLLGVALLG